MRRVFGPDDRTRTGREMEDSGGTGEWDGGGGDWSIVGEDRPKRKERGYHSPDSDVDNPQVKVMRPDKKSDDGFKVLIKVKGGVGFSAASPLKLTNELKKELGDVMHASILQNGMISIICKSARQQDKVLKLKNVLGKGVEVFKPRISTEVKGVVYNVSLEVSEQELLSCLKGANVIAAKRMGNGENGRGTTPILLTFKDGMVPKRVMLGYMSYPVREYERPPLRCFKCQRYGHVAAVCRGKQRCRRCSKDHDGKECNEPVKCCNCGGDHPASFRGCQNYVKAGNVERVKKENKISYAEAARRVEENRVGSQIQSQSTAVARDVAKGHAIAVNDDSVLISKKGLLAFMVEAMWRVKTVAKKKSDVAREIASAAERLLGFKGINPKEIWEFTYSQESEEQRANGSHHPGLDDNEEAEMESTFGDSEGD